MAQADPGTRSPGRLVIAYQTLGLEHLSAAWLVEGVDIDASIDQLRDDASAFANALMDSCPNTSFAHSWSIVDPDGVQLVSENFSSPIAGTRSASDTLAAHSVQYTVTGKGESGSVALKSGITRTSIFAGLFPTSGMFGKDFLIATDGILWDLVSFLRDNDRIGADKFGQKATYSSRGLIQINAYWQREFGL